MIRYDNTLFLMPSKCNQVVTIVFINEYWNHIYSCNLWSMNFVVDINTFLLSKIDYLTT